jgi:hypothetical protein
MNSLEKNIKPYSKAIIKLLKGVVERNSTVWEDVIHYQTQIQDYISQIGLELIIKKDDGFAFVKQFEDSEGKTLGLATRTKISFETSIILVVLRQILEDFDNLPTQLAAEKFITNIQIKEELELLLKEGYNKLKFQQNLDKYIKNVVNLGYLKEINQKENETKYQIHRIIKEKITLNILQDFKIKLQEYDKSI